MTLTAEEIRAAHPGNRSVAYHAPRYARALSLVDELASDGVDSCLDVGRSVLTSLLAERLGTVDSLGFGADRETPLGRHWSFDLNRSQRREDWRTDLPTYDLVVMAEVIEHVHTAPELVLAFVASLLNDDGRLLLQTPNAASWNKRLVLLAGRNPYHAISTNPLAPAHFREYTSAEMVRHAAAAGLVVERRIRESYFDHRFRTARPANRRSNAMGSFANFVGAVCPPSMKRGMTFVLTKRRVS